jgi:hypothetical protein
MFEAADPAMGIVHEGSSQGGFGMNRQLVPRRLSSFKIKLDAVAD